MLTPLLVLWTLAPVPAAQGVSPAPDFAVETLASGLERPTDFLFDGDARAWVAEQPGRVRVLVWDELDAEEPPTEQLVLDIADEVLTFHDLGLIGIALHPTFVADGKEQSWLYALYTVDRGPTLDIPTGEEDNASFGRLARWRVAEEDGVLAADPESRQVLLGEQLEDGTAPTGIAVLSLSHQGGGLLFGSDGTLLVSTGDGASFYGFDLGGEQPFAFDDFVHPVSGLFGPLPKNQDIGAFRAQSLASLAGKVLRIDPETGLGLDSNPFFDGDPASLASRVFAMGFRNPFRMTRMPGTGSLDASEGDPGTLVVGDVGAFGWEEIDVVERGANLGWPCVEGLDAYEPFASHVPPESSSAIPYCAEPLVPPTPPALAWRRNEPAGLHPAGVHVDLAGAPLGGFTGFCAIGGVFYEGELYPEPYHGRYVFADYGLAWVRALSFGEEASAETVVDFASGLPGPIAVRTHPASGDVVVLGRHFVTQLGTLHRFVHAPGTAPDWTTLGTLGLAGDLLTLAGGAPPVIGGLLAFAGAGADGPLPGILAAATSGAVLPLFSITVLVSPLAPVLLPVLWDSEGTFELGFGLPAAPELVGVPLFFQAFALDAALPGGIAASNGLFASVKAP